VPARLQAGAADRIEPAANLPDVLTADEFGFKGFEALTWWDCFGTSGVSTEISERFAMR